MNVVKNLLLILAVVLMTVATTLVGRDVEHDNINRCYGEAIKSMDEWNPSTISKFYGLPESFKDVSWNAYNAYIDHLAMECWRKRAR